MESPCLDFLFHFATRHQYLIFPLPFFYNVQRLCFFTRFCQKDYAFSVFMPKAMPINLTKDVSAATNVVTAFKMFSINFSLPIPVSFLFILTPHLYDIKIYEYVKPHLKCQTLYDPSYI